MDENSLNTWHRLNTSILQSWHFLAERRGNRGVRGERKREDKTSGGDTGCIRGEGEDGTMEWRQMGGGLKKANDRGRGGKIAGSTCSK